MTTLNTKNHASQTEELFTDLQSWLCSELSRSVPSLPLKTAQKLRLNTNAQVQNVL